MSHKSRTSFAGSTFAVVYSVTLPATDTHNQQRLDVENWSVNSTDFRIRVTEITPSGAAWCWYAQDATTGKATIWGTQQAAVDAVNAYAVTRTGTIG